MKSSWLESRISFGAIAARSLGAVGLTIGLSIVAGCGDDAPAASGQSATVSPSSEPSPWFTDIAASSGIDFLHRTGYAGEFYFPEIAASGCTLFDYDNDGDLDVYLVQGYPLKRLVESEAGFAAASADGAGANRLYRNDLVVKADGRRAPMFVDVTDEAGVGDPGYGMGCAVGDYDNDGDLDLYVTNFGPNTLYRNNGDGMFEDASAEMPPESRWSTSAAFTDVDRDGRLDLFVTNYVNYSVLENKACHSASGRRDYCGPQSFEPVRDSLYQNVGHGTFEDVTIDAGLDTAYGSGLGVVCADFNLDGWPDIYVANDGNANQLWMNTGDGTFVNEALLAGAAYNADGKAEAGMGVTAGDFDGDGDEDIFLSHLLGEKNTLLVNDGRGNFDDLTDDYALSALSRPFTGFGTRWFDLDNDGRLDLFIANGAVTMEAHLGDDPYPFGNPNLVLRNLGPSTLRFEDVTAQCGPTVSLIETSRGAAFGDIDNDGDTDILYTNSNGPVRLLRNDLGDRRSWIALQLVGTDSNRDAIGALVTLHRDGAPDLVRRVHADGSYCAASDLRIQFGLGDARGPQRVGIRWPSGLVERYEGLAAQQFHRLREGGGVAMP